MLSDNRNIRSINEKKLPLSTTETNWYLFNILYRYFGLFLGLVWTTILYLQNLEMQTSFVLFATIIGLIVFNFFNTRFLTRKNHPLVRDILSFAFNLASISLLVYTTGGYLSSLWVMYLIPLMALSITANSSQIYIGIAAASILQSMFYFQFLFFSNPYQGTLLIKIGIFVIVGTAFKKAADLERVARHQEMKKNEELSKIKDFNQDIFRELIKSEELYRELFENARDIIFIVNEEGTFTSANLAAHQLWNQAPDEINQLNIIQLVTPSEQVKIKYMIENLIKQKTIRQPLALKVCKKDQTIVELEVQGRAIFRGDRFEGIQFIARDVTMEKKIKEQLIQSEKMSVLGEVISGFTHELSNPLTAVVSFSQIIERAPVEERDKILLQIKENALRCKKIIENLVTFTRSYKSEKRLCSINKCLETVLKIREYELKSANIELIRQYDQDIYLMVDENKLQQAFFNLLNNAHQTLSACNNPSKQISVKTSIKEEQIIIEFSDTGEGIPKEILPKIFNPFFTTKEKNTGLGLSVSYGIIKEHGGNIFAQNNPAGGAQFIIELPIPKE